MKTNRKYTIISHNIETVKMFKCAHHWQSAHSWMCLNASRPIQQQARIFV